MSKKWRCRRHCCHSIVAGTTAVVPARFVTHLRVANRLRRLCPLGDGELFKFYLKSSVCQRQTGVAQGQPALRLPCGACRGLRAARRSGHPVDATAEGSSATDSRQPKRGFGTAVPKTTIEVAERSPERLMPQHFSPRTSEALFAGACGRSGFFRQSDRHF